MAKEGVHLRLQPRLHTYRMEADLKTLSLKRTTKGPLQMQEPKAKVTSHRPKWSCLQSSQQLPKEYMLQVWVQVPDTQRQNTRKVKAKGL
jgi:hypothetical protein